MRAIQSAVPNIAPRANSVAIYTRVSTQQRRFDSDESQVAICRGFIRKHAAEGWHEVACCTDTAHSGGTGAAFRRSNAKSRRANHARDRSKQR